MFLEKYSNLNCNIRYLIVLSWNKKFHKAMQADSRIEEGVVFVEHGSEISSYVKGIGGEESTDFNIICNRKVIRAHRTIFGTASNYLLELFMLQPKGSFNFIMSPQVKAKDVDHVLTYVYKSQVKVTGEAKALGFLRAAMELRIDDLMKACKKRLAISDGENNAGTSLQRQNGSKGNNNQENGSERVETFINNTVNLEEKKFPFEGNLEPFAEEPKVTEEKNEQQNSNKKVEAFTIIPQIQEEKDGSQTKNFDPKELLNAKTPTNLQPKDNIDKDSIFKVPMMPNKKIRKAKVTKNDQKPPGGTKTKKCIPLLNSTNKESAFSNSVSDRTRSKKGTLNSNNSKNTKEIACEQSKKPTIRQLIGRPILSSTKLYPENPKVPDRTKEQVEKINSGLRAKDLLIETVNGTLKGDQEINKENETFVVKKERVQAGMSVLNEFSGNRTLKARNTVDGNRVKGEVIKTGFSVTELVEKMEKEQVIKAKLVHSDSSLDESIAKTSEFFKKTGSESSAKSADEVLNRFCSINGKNNLKRKFTKKRPSNNVQVVSTFDEMCSIKSRFESHRVLKQNLVKGTDDSSGSEEDFGIIRRKVPPGKRRRIPASTRPLTQSATTVSSFHPSVRRLDTKRKIIRKRVQPQQFI